VDLQKHIQKAEEAVRRRNWDFAIELYRQLIDLDPDQADARGGLRRALRGRAEDPKAGKRGKWLRAAAGAAPLAKARAMARLGRHESCARALEDYLAQNPLDADANLMLGESLEAAGFFNSARAVYEFVAEIDPRNPEGLKRAGEMLRHAGDPLRALEYYERALEADPRDRDALKARKDLSAEAALARADLEGAGHSRERLVDAEEAADLERSRRRHMGAEDLREELERMKDRFAEAPSDAEVMLRLADLHERLGEPEEALGMVERALSYRRDSFELLRRAGDLRLAGLRARIDAADRAGDGAEAQRLEEEAAAFQLEHLRARVAQRPADAEERLGLGSALLAAGEADEALAELQKAVQDGRVEGEARFLMARCFQRKGFGDLARTEYERALEGAEVGGDRAKEILYALGSIFEVEGDLEGARARYARIFEVDIGYRDVAAKMEELR
jgi:tetratricopeptide (TPR) repeat protein